MEVYSVDEEFFKKLKYEKIRRTCSTRQQAARICSVTAHLLLHLYTRDREKGVIEKMKRGKCRAISGTVVCSLWSAPYIRLTKHASQQKKKEPPSVAYYDSAYCVCVAGLTRGFGFGVYPEKSVCERASHRKEKGGPFIIASGWSRYLFMARIVMYREYTIYQEHHY